jgi:hypothetical protein
MLERRSSLAMVALVLGGCVNAAGANGAPVSQGPASQGFDTSRCHSLGAVVGVAGGKAAAPYIFSNQDLARYALNDLRTKAAALGANYVQNESPQFDTGGGSYYGGGAISTASVKGTAYHCEGPSPQQASAQGEIPARDGGP